MKELDSLKGLLSPSLKAMLEKEEKRREQPRLVNVNKAPSIIKHQTIPSSPLITNVVKYSTDYYLDKFITANADMVKTKEKCKRLSTVKDTILIQGPTGTGKELLAKALHGDRTGAFIPVNCGGFPENIVDSILFGHVKGSFTGAERDHQGIFISAQGGTVFLDEISELPLFMQSKLLRVLQEHEVVSVGSSQIFKTDARVICATNKDLASLVKEEEFRRDLYWRINTFVLYTTDLRYRPEDIDLYIAVNKIEISNDNRQKLKELIIQSTGNYRALQHYIRRLQVFGTLYA